ncbi:hypothetical protein QBC32DRAFT_330595 [Pseudoneurospora amorphoporcata]|uniref:Uncharacterized protein n=1 Tax=Pseudoneurospora amorphoporcata TaxID=241081 RepID=A0AAN6SK78_9PEZI|nr:hypothetical protein QBC32DRAFT_330595 [Pseudoneurospora amorphoporcata]
MSSFLATGRGMKGQGHGRTESSLRATPSIRESFGEKINDPGVAVLIREPKKTLSQYSRVSRVSRDISEKALPEIPESVPIGLGLAGRPRTYTKHWERTGRASPNTFGSLMGGEWEKEEFTSTGYLAAN